MLEKIRRINLMAGAGAGKSITATNVRAQLGFKGYKIELVDEVIKEWTYVPRTPKGSDQLLIFVSQLQKEDLRLRAGVDLIVSDSPLLLISFYAHLHRAPFAETMLSISKEVDKMYPSHYVFIEREDAFYSEVGRYETLSQAKKIDDSIKEFMINNSVDFCSISCTSQERIIEHLDQVLGE